MKKILIALAMSGFVYCSAEAQTDGKKNCGTTQDRVCRKSSDNSISCYKTKYAENFKVCKGNFGYYICCEAPENSNSTRPSATAVAMNQYSRDYDNQVQADNQNNAANFVAPVSQSFLEYSANASTSYEGYYNTPKGKMKVCYGGDNVAELTHNPWVGCPSPENDGPDKNNQRNMNIVK